MFSILKQIPTAMYFLQSICLYIMRFPYYSVQKTSQVVLFPLQTTQEWIEYAVIFSKLLFVSYFFQGLFFCRNRIIMNSYNLIFVKICFNDPSNVRFECNYCTLVRHMHEVYTVSVLIFPKFFATCLFLPLHSNLYIINNHAYQNNKIITLTCLSSFLLMFQYLFKFKYFTHDNRFLFK